VRARIEKKKETIQPNRALFWFPREVRRAKLVNWKKAEGIKDTPIKDNLDQSRAICSFGEAYINELGHSQINIARVIRKKSRLSLEAFSRIKTNTPMASIIHPVRKTARARGVKS